MENYQVIESYRLVKNFNSAKGSDFIDFYGFIKCKNLIRLYKLLEVELFTL